MGECHRWKSLGECARRGLRLEFWVSPFLSVRVFKSFFAIPSVCVHTCRAEALMAIRASALWGRSCNEVSTVTTLSTASVRVGPQPGFAGGEGSKCVRARGTWLEPPPWAGVQVGSPRRSIIL